MALSRRFRPLYPAMRTCALASARKSLYSIFTIVYSLSEFLKNIFAGSRLLLVGDNEAGKSTLLRVQLLEDEE
jgi:ABC-type polysaccharide/polyol phosphate transport system ATPase subunit